MANENDPAKETVANEGAPGVRVATTSEDPVVPIVTVEATTIVQKTETVVVFKVNRPLMDYEYDELEKRVRLENEKSGVKIVLVPYSVDASISEG
ncbi:hypothetical protein SOV_50910 [Sporomusa ovata DSM 2662]|uniref:Uncharacterized protein n=2 Tax=Sporomusa ovata TaxID=2378 RepID=A0A0U1L0U9_9FIRM|nr:hypothetical protein [Sporomusa ovata]EQB27464.1 hypothetical protein SOV_2c03600 [Sporomusa ovata DSM 2662]CQR73308.1 hypothetical protein SpAn4DRAFT_2540 [Sporomusa ovata]